MRDLLFLSHRIPFPPNKGDKIRSFHILRHLSSQFRVHLGCFADDPDDLRHMDLLRGMCAEVMCIPLTAKQKLVRAARAVATGGSITESTYSDPRMASWVDEKLADEKIVDTFVFCSAVFQYVSGAAHKGRVVLDMVDVDSEKWAAYARYASWPLRVLYRREREKLFRLERCAAETSDACLFVSKAEATCFERLVSNLTHKIHDLQNGVELEHAANGPVPNPFPPDIVSIVFTGMMNYRPNADAVGWFAEEVMPGLRKAHPNAEFWIVGAEPSGAVRRLGRMPGIRVTGRVDDVRPYFAHATCVVAPLRIARGVQNKVLEAMAMEKPVILTPAALEGLDAVAGRDVLVAHNAADFVQSVSAVVGGRHPQLGTLGRGYVETHHNWCRNLQMLDRLFPPEPRAAEEPRPRRRELQSDDVCDVRAT